MSEASSDLVRTSSFTDDQLAEINSWDDLGTAIGLTGLAQVDSSTFGTGYELLEKKDRLVGTPFAILDWAFREGDYDKDRGYVSLIVLTKSGEKWIVNDGSTGIYDQMKGIDKKLGGTPTVIKVGKGLRKSEYTFVDDKGVEKPATTYYLSMERGQ